ncbi:MAG: potassium transporter Kup [Phycisphaerales bacterium]|nr:potassium transporter Kup [Phycisphaerales bacterium]
MQTTRQPDVAADRSRVLGLSLLALGIVFGDIGTSPLYALRECFGGAYGIAPNHANVLGVLSLIVWSLVIVITVKYLSFVMRADSRGEGGIFALLALLHAGERHRSAPRVLVLLGVAGAALLYGDGAITPAISVLSAVEGLSVAAPALHQAVIPVTTVILVGLFAVQRHGTARIGTVFGPVMLVWFLVLGLLGGLQILRTPQVLWALNPWHAARFLATGGITAYLVLGAVFLVVTGGEALYADMGHFGRRPIRVAWHWVVFGSLLLNYLGQGGLLLSSSAPVANPFYALAPSWGLYPLIVLATVATIIASQALISGIFSLTAQAIALGYLPRMPIDHTSDEQRGQIYIGPANWGLMVATVALVFGFKSSSGLAAAYGIAVTGTMAITTLLFYAVMRRRWNWSRLRAGSIAAGFLIVDLAFLGANTTKINDGGWFPIAAATIVFTLMTTWRTGRSVLAERFHAGARPLSSFLKAIAYDPPHRVPGTAVFMSGDTGGTPIALLHNLLHNKVIHHQVIVLSVVVEEDAHVPAGERVKCEALGHGFFRVTLTCGYMDEPDVPRALMALGEEGPKIDSATTTYFLGRETLLPRKRKGFALWRQRIFVRMSQNAFPAWGYFHLPSHRVIEIGQQGRI